MIGRLRVPDLVAGAGGFALVAALFLHWYGLTLPGGRALGPEVTGWQAFSVLDVVLALLALVPFALVVLQATRDSPALPVLFSVLTTVAGFVAAVLILYRIVNQPGPNDVVEVQAGAWLGAPRGRRGHRAAAGARCGWRPCPAGRSGRRAHALARTLTPPAVHRLPGDAEP